ncbi:hypothetical protein [Streptomyces coelicoflavus]|uniref:hypothetical protein n=1 Tax=Streptomyces coelicoflavus TaxID=285562 RepID=UPI0035AB8E20
MRDPRAGEAGPAGRFPEPWTILHTSSPGSAGPGPRSTLHVLAVLIGLYLLLTGVFRFVAVFDTFVRFLHDSTRTLLVVAVVTAPTAYLYGPGRAARGTAARATAAAGRALHRSGVDTGSTGRLPAKHRTWATGAVVER